MTKEIIILSLIILVIYLYYQQNRSSIDKRSYDDLIKDLKRQVQHYQGLYQKRVEKDLDKKEWGTQTDLSDRQVSNLIGQWNEVAEWATSEGIDINKKWNLGMLKGKLEQKNNQSTQHIQQLNKQITALTILADKRKKDLEREKQALITLAKQKIANKKEAGELVKQLEEKWQQDKEEWNQEKKELIEQLQQDYQTKLTTQEQTHATNRKTWQEYLKEKESKITEQEKKIKRLEQIKDNSQQALIELQNQEKELIKKSGKLEQELVLKNNWGDNNLPQLKQELFSQAQATFNQLKEQLTKSTVVWGRKEVGKKLEELEEFFEEQKKKKNR